MAREDPQLKLRLTQEMKDHITNAAKDNNRSVNAEIVARLEVSLAADKLEWKEENLLSMAAQQTEELLKEMRDQTRVMKWMQEQQSATVRMLEHIANTDGHLNPAFMEALRIMLANKGTDKSGFPDDPNAETK